MGTRIAVRPGRGREPAVRIAHADGSDEILSFDDIAARSAQFAHWLTEQGIGPGERIAFVGATGSGKTRMGIHLIGAIWDQKLRKGGLRQGKAIMVCPPVVQSAWNMESHLVGVPLDSVSHGKLSHSRSREHEETIEALRRAQILELLEAYGIQVRKG